MRTAVAAILLGFTATGWAADVGEIKTARGSAYL